ncbi:MAG: pyruvate formate lyase family protein [Clostridiales bacterium]|nr:pyruvate formate lyase family protein [Clostridiales bacterium]
MTETAKAKRLEETAKALFKEERAMKRLDGWFIAKETVCDIAPELDGLDKRLRAARELYAVCEKIPLFISDNAIFAGTQRNAFARTYALINPDFKVENFCGYCDPTAIFGDIEPNGEFTRERIGSVLDRYKATPFVRELTKVYDENESDTKEVVYFMEQVTGHTVCDFGPALRDGVLPLIETLDKKIAAEADEYKKTQYKSMKLALEASLILARRYAEIAHINAFGCRDGERKSQLERIESTLRRVPLHGCRDLYEAIQSFMILWQTMCLEQAPNPYAFSVGNADRIFEPFRAMGGTSREDAAALFEHLLVFFNVGDRSWAISQDLIVGGRDENGEDLTNLTSYALLDAYFNMNLPQPILSVKLHKNTPEQLYREMGRFFFSPGVLTPSLFNDDALFPLLRSRGVDEAEIKDYAIAGCQEPLIMGRDSGNTTNSWLNLPKVLELTLTGGDSLITGEHLADVKTGTDATDTLKNIREYFYANLSAAVDRMVKAANGATKALSNLPVPFLSAFMGGIETGADMRDVTARGTKYCGSGCLIHGLSVLADSFVAIDRLVAERPDLIPDLVPALKADFEGYGELHAFLRSCPKYGNGLDAPDSEAAEICSRVSDEINSKKNNWGEPFRADWSSPTTHLLYGYWVGATPDGRRARTELNYGVDPLFGDADQGMGFRVLSLMKLPFEKMVGGCACHFGVDPKFFPADDLEGKGEQFAARVLKPLFFNPANRNPMPPFYLYVNVATPYMLRKVLAEPEKYAPSGVYIVRIHGTFVNFLDLSPAIQQDIIDRLDPASTTC